MAKKNEKDKTTLQVRCSPELKKALLKIAEEEERTLSGQVVYFLKQAVRRYKNGDGG